MELAAQEARPVPRVARSKQLRSKGTGAIANPAVAVVATNAEINRKQEENKSLIISLSPYFSYFYDR